ncbi:hypothetical protein EW026_g7385 [Hermanssonia centrifuga]|uniref:Tat pathway signal sequence n=1 Tax=Hermanssonia centrifuga TaxID=98765 RepID=A0A4S4K808_9APHY|nr:hypothetical protein EW026_g7385 [Hermanssonia centrifuga]
MTLADVEYKALLTDENYESSSADDTKGEVLRARSTWAQRYVVFWIASIVHIIITLSLALSLYYVTHTGYEGCQTSSPREALLYCNTLPFAIPFYSLTVVLAPAQEAVTYEVKNFIIGLHDGHPKTLFGAEPSYEVDEAWGKPCTTIPEMQAKLLPNKTLPIPGDTGNYVVALSVFHELHCLNVIRKALHPDYYVDPVTGAIGNIVKDDLPDHLNHCVDTIRQALMCAADITPHVWHWDEERKISLPAFHDAAHVCRSYDNIVEWAKTHRMKHHFDETVHIEAF